MSQQRPALGRGLGALIPRSQSGVSEIEVARIRPNPAQPRVSFDQTSLRELADSIREHGLLQPVIVTRSDEGYTLVAGERRWRAAQLAELHTIPAVIREVAPRQQLLLALVENVQREDLSPLEQAAAFRTLVTEYGLTHEELAERVGKSRTAVANTVRLLQLPPAAMQALSAGQITEGHARALLGSGDETSLLEALAIVIEQGLNVRQTEELVRRLAAPRPSAPERKETADDEDEGPHATRDVHVAALEERLRHALGTKVQLFRSRRGGKLVIHFYDDEQLTGLIEAITGDRD